MRKISPHRAVVLVCLLLLVAAVAAVVMSPQYYVSVLVVVGIKALATIGLTILLISGQVSLGHAAYMGIGAYIAAIAARNGNIPPIVALGLGVAGAAVAGLVVGAATLRLRGIFLPLATLAVGIATPAAIVALGGITGGASGLTNIPRLAVGPFVVADDRIFAVFVWVLVAVIGGGLARFMYSRTGRAIAALRTHESMAEIFGVNTTRLKLNVIVLAAALAGLAGGLYAFFFQFLSPAPFALSASINLLIASVLGGGHPFGAILGSIGVTVLEIVLQNTIARNLGMSGHVELMVFGIILIAVLLKWPGGLWSAIAPFWPIYAPPKPERNVELAPAGQVNSTQLLAVDAVGKNFSGLWALRNISFDVSTREIVGLIGPNGAGKSTTFNVVSGLTRPTTGSVRVIGAAPPEKVFQLVERGVARTFQHVKIIPGLTVLENVALGAYQQSKAGFFAGMFGFDKAEEARTLAKAWRALELVGIDSLAHQDAALLAMGQARLVEIARALVCRPNLLLLDEPAAGLRTGEKLQLVSLLHRLKRSGTSVLLVEHDMDLVMNCVDRVIVLDRGSGLASGLPEEVRTDPRVIAAYLGA